MDPPTPHNFQSSCYWKFELHFSQLSGAWKIKFGNDFLSSWFLCGGESTALQSIRVETKATAHVGIHFHATTHNNTRIASRIAIIRIVCTVIPLWSAHRHTSHLFYIANTTLGHLSEHYHLVITNAGIMKYLNDATFQEWSAGCTLLPW